MEISKRTFVFIGSVLTFSLDSVVNYFLPVPIYVSFTLILFGIFLLPGFLPKEHYYKFLGVVLFFGFPFLINCLKVGLSKESLSDLLYIFIFYGSFFLYSNSSQQRNFEYIKPKFVFLFCLLCVLLFVPTFFGLTERSTMEFDTADIEYRRSYRQGFFRIAHIASYFFAILLLFIICNRKNKIFGKLAISFFLLFFLFLTGSRTALVVLMLGIFMYFFRRKFIVVSIVIGVSTYFLTKNIDSLLNISNDTIFFQYISFFKTATSNFERLSRIIIWNSWWLEVKNFGLNDFLWGRGFSESFNANERNIYNRIWFHNDFLSIFYSYGLLPTILYVWLFFYIFSKNKVQISSSLYLYMAFASFWLSGIFNGFYYYYPSILLYIFYAMIKIYDESGNFRYSGHSK